jgi:hypothetical protein
VLSLHYILNTVINSVVSLMSTELYVIRIGLISVEHRYFCERKYPTVLIPCIYDSSHKSEIPDTSLAGLNCPVKEL